MLGPLHTTFLLLWANLYELTPLAARMLLGPGITAAMLKANSPEMKRSY